MNPQPTIDVMRQAAQTLRAGDVREQMYALQDVQHAVDAAKAALLAELDSSKDFEIDGASTLSAWVRNQLRMNAGQASQLVRNAAALRDLPLVAQAALAGRISAAHVQVFAYGLKHVGLEPMREFEDVLVQVARENAPSELFEAVKHLRDRLYPEDLDEAWNNGMDKEDFQVSPVPDGWHVTGFLNTATGAKLKKVLDSVSAPRDKDDTRTGSQRRVQGLDDLLSRVLGEGLPSDKGVRPHVSVFVDADTVQAAADQAKQAAENPWVAPDRMPPVEPARLAGHGAIGPNLLMYLLCVSDVTAFVMKDSSSGSGLTHRGDHRSSEARQVAAAKLPVCARNERAPRVERGHAPYGVLVPGWSD